jgi:RHS repeat-associated protein
MWIAPYNGTVTIENKVQLIEDTSYSRKQSYKVDGVKYSIQKGGTIVYKDRIKANDYSVHLSDTSIQVLKDDIIYFRLESMLDRSYDNVHWNPSIIYSAIDNNNNIDTNDVDAEGKKIAVFRPSDDLLIGNNQKFIAPFSGNIRIKGDITVDHVSDELFFKLKYGRMATWLQHNFNMDTLQTYHIDNTFYVSKDSTIDFSAFTYTNIDFNKVHYDLSMIYLNRDGNSLDTTKTSERIIIRPVMSFNIYENTKQKSVPYQFSGGNYLIEPQASIPFYDPLGSNCSIEFAVKSNNKTLAKWEIPISFGNLVNPSRYVNIPTGSDVYFEAYAKSGTLYEISSMSVKVNNGTTPYNVGLYDKFGQIMMKYGNLYKGWGQFSYYEDGDTIQTLPINYSLVTAFENDTNLINSLSTSSIIDETSAQNSLSLGGVNDPSHNPFNTMTPDMGLDVYVDYCRFAYIGKDKMSNMVLRESVSGFLNDTVYDSPLIISSDPNAPIMTIGKSTVDISNSYSIASGMSDKLSYSHNKTKSQVVTDYMDINGDKYPDIIGTLFVQYSTPQGGLFDNVVQNLNVNEFQKTNNMSQGTAAGVDMPTSGHPFFPLKGTGNPQTTISESHYSSSGSFELSGYSGESVSDFDLIDVNGDGLPDKVLNDVEGHVALNLGYTFSGPIPWGFVSKNKSYNASGSLSGVSSFSYGQYSWSGGFELSYSDNHSDQVAVDLNGDGLMDYIERNNSNLIAYINSGNSVGSPNIFTHPQNSDELHIHKSYSISGSGDLAASAGIPIVFIKIVINGHGFMSFSGNFEKLLLVDFNNDGYPDIVEANPGSDNSITVRYNNLAKINLLKEVITPTSAKYLFNYDLTQCDQKMPQRQMVLSSLKVYDGYAGDGQDTVYQSFSYANGYYDRYDRDFYGFETVTTEQYDPVSLASGGIYRSTVEKYHNQDYLFKGIKYYEALMKGIDHKIVETYYKFDRKEISSGKVIPADSAQCYGPYYPAISQEDRFFYAENTNTPIHTQKKYKHGKFGNIEKYTNRGDVADPTDDLFATISYDYDTVQYHLLSMVNTIVVRDTNNQDLRSRKAYYYDGKGRPNRISEYSSSGSVDITYDTYGNIKRIAYPPNNNNQRMTYKYMYDNQVHTYPILIVDTLGFENHTFYDYRLGVPLSVVDITGNAIQYEYYNDGRLKSITSPKELAASGAPYTMRFEYHHGPEDKKIFSATTSVLDATQLPNIFYFGTVLYSDGLGRNIRTVKNIVENGTDKFLISGKQEFDGYGRVVKAHLPISDYSYPSLTAFDINFTNPYSAATYDEQDRPITQTTPDLKTTSYEYGFGTDALGSLRFKTKVTDANGNYAINYTNPMGKTTSTDNALQLITKFAYNPMGELMESTDPEDNTTIYTYDLLGRMISCIHPDAGTTSYEYDLAGNLLTLQTENLAQSHSEIRYDYDFNRLISTTYPNNPENNVEYEYGDVNSGNNVGRLVKMQDASGVQEFNYGNMGEMIENTHTYLVPGGDPITFKMAWEYDSWNRLLNITYPDGEMVNYHYNNAGSLTSMDGVKGSDSYYYIWDIQYDLYGKRNKIFYGNGALSEYTYDPINQTLTNLKTYDGSYNLLQDINYTYDNTNNISSIENIASNSFVDSYQYNYTYDEIYRLTNATGNYTINHIAYPFSLGMEYSASGNILNKTQSYTKTTNGSMSAISYDNDYFYNDRPHTVTEAGNMLYSWDLNGNMVYREDQNTQAGRYLCWDEENRLMSARDFDTENAYTSSYIYDAGGERVWKLAGQDQIMYINGNVAVSFLAYNKTLYTNPYMVLTESEYTKHYYIEGERVCSKIGSGFGTAPFMPNTSSLTPIEGTVESISADLSNYVNKTVECVGSTSTVEIGPTFDYLENGGNQPEQNQYFYHSDHLGSSSYITDISGSAVQHLQYMPFGETMVDERTYSTFNSRYTFSGKEKDDETQYSYFGARYYDSDLSVWLSVDPLADKYPTMSPFMYCAGNPVVLVDPDGLSSIIPPTKGMYDKNEISPEAQQRFEAILHNLPTFLENKDFVNAFTQTTGLSEAELQTFLTYNTGPTLTIGPGTDCHANNKDNFTFGADIINYLGSLTENDCNEIYEQSFGMGLVLIDELTHCGDMKFNNNKTGTGVTGTPPGEQNWHYSPNNHRGGDPKIFGFGVTTSTMVDDGTTRLGVKRHRGEVVIHPYNYSSDLQGNKRPPILPNIPLYTNSELLQFGSKLLGE